MPADACTVMRRGASQLLFVVVVHEASTRTVGDLLLMGKLLGKGELLLWLDLKEVHLRVLLLLLLLLGLLLLGLSCVEHLLSCSLIENLLTHHTCLLYLALLRESLLVIVC